MPSPYDFFDPPLDPINTSMTYSHRVKRAVLNRLNSGMTIRAVSFEMDISAKTIQNWCREDQSFEAYGGQKRTRRDEKPQTIGLCKTAEQVRAERLEAAKSKGDHYRALSLSLALRPSSTHED